MSDYTNVRSEIDTSRFAVNYPEEAYDNVDKLVPSFVVPEFVSGVDYDDRVRVRCADDWHTLSSGDDRARTRS
jgi:hypothetical protein